MWIFLLDGRGGIVFVAEGEILTERNHERCKHFSCAAHSPEVVGEWRRVVGFEVGWDAAYGVGFAEDAGEFLEGGEGGFGGRGGGGGGCC